jgi:hypothetical protein
MIERTVHDDAAAAVKKGLISDSAFICSKYTIHVHRLKAIM